MITRGTPYLEVHDETLFGSHMGGVGAGMRESLPTVVTLERLLSRMNTDVLLFPKWVN